MGRKLSILTGIMLILLGGAALMCNLSVPVLGLDLWEWGAWRLWPLIVVSGGLFFILPPLLLRGRRGLGALFIPGVPILVTGGILFLVSLSDASDAWEIWEWAWPLEVLAVAMGFFLAAVKMRVIWLLIPAIVVGANGMLLQFCALTEMWEIWAVMWTIEPTALGLSFLLISAVKRSMGLLIAGLILCGVAGMGLLMMSAIFPGWWLVNLIGPVLIIGVGLLMLVTSIVRRPVARVLG